MPKLMDMDGVTGGEAGFPIELWRDDDTGRLVIRGYNESGFNVVDIDLNEVRVWLASADAAEWLNAPANAEQSA